MKVTNLKKLKNSGRIQKYILIEQKKGREGGERETLPYDRMPTNLEKLTEFKNHSL